MSQMLNQAGGQSPGSGYQSGMQGMPQPSAKGSSLGLSGSPHYGQLSSLQQQHHQMLQQQQQQLGGGAGGTPILGSGAMTTFRRPAHTTSIALNPLLAKDADTSPQVLEAGVSVSASGDAQQVLEGGLGDEKETANLANTKEKTPMCLVNELARYNKVAHQYTLMDEQGPAHKKTFFVKLKLGAEEYSAQGESIKKAQHAAADIALLDTKLSHPAPKPPRALEDDVNNITPTVELNAVAMKRGEAAIYKLIEPRNQQNPHQPANMDFRGMYNQRYHYGRPPRPFYVMLKVGQREFIGDGPTRQAARHSAAAKALRVLKNSSAPDEVKEKSEEEAETEDAMKSEISLVHEIALKRNLPVTFEVTRESGPPHMKNFVTKCLVGDMVTESEGNSKKLAKKRAAELMLEELRKLPGSPPQGLKPKVKPPNNKKKNRNLIKVQKADPSYGVGVNPISRLIQIMQAQKKKEPVYTLLAEKGLPRRREFVMQCQVEESVSEGVGPNKKLAKRNAAESMLQLLGFSRPSPQPTKPAIKSTPSTEGGGGSDKKVTFGDQVKPATNGVSGDANSAGCQVVPGLLRLNQSGAASVQKLMGPGQPGAHFAPQQAELSDNVNTPTPLLAVKLSTDSLKQEALQFRQQISEGCKFFSPCVGESGLGAKQENLSPKKSKKGLKKGEDKKRRSKGLNLLDLDTVLENLEEMESKFGYDTLVEGAFDRFGPESNFGYDPMVEGAFDRFSPESNFGYDPFSF